MCEKDVLERLYEVVLERKRNPQEGSYTCYLFDKGLDKILKKVGEESAETIIAAKNGVAPRDGGRDFRPYLSSDGASGGPGDPAERRDGGAGPAQSENRQPEAVPHRGPGDLRQRVRQREANSGGRLAVPRFGMF